MNKLLKIITFILLLTLTSCYTSYVSYDSVKKKSEKEVEFRNPKYNHHPTYTGYSIFGASALGATVVGLSNPWYELEGKKSKVGSVVVGLSAVVITGIIVKTIFYPNYIKERNEQKWLDDFKYKMKFIDARYGQKLSSGSFYGTKWLIREVKSIRAYVQNLPSSVDTSTVYYNFDRMFYEDEINPK